ncbi:hypothetical protein IV203_025125 [Nitzschia inconspicua]|uniref:Uncharacterized protein n=1 Tax=Nitzschia inconspicua TaxID=303405 RepID=A0A9K3LBR1_9STRA|nr:hypothetical protein IV203_002618 [Nitzschia inconspicua]KAG7359359.1 hypothetical protein IV203_034457 [Nitzschia inconspicua]KAG7365684.1 hypothetical protein IV203_025125 [Nitzschia inconspicua]
MILSQHIKLLYLTTFLGAEGFLYMDYICSRMVLRSKPKPFSERYPFLPYFGRELLPRTTATILRYTLEDGSEKDNSNYNANTSIHSSHTPFFVDTSQLISNQDDQTAIFNWIAHLSSVERSDPTWIDEDFLTTLSPSSLLQEHMESLLPLEIVSHSISQVLFPTEWSRHKFDLDWKESFLKSMPSIDLEDILQQHGRSNTHPLRLQLVAIPPNTTLPFHVHPAIEFNVPILGQLWHRVPNQNDGIPATMVSRDLLQRQWQHQLGSPLSVNTFSPHPTPQELAIISIDLSNRLQQSGGAVLAQNVTFQEGVVLTGQCMVNMIGSIHQSYTQADKTQGCQSIQSSGDDQQSGGCLLWALGPSVHAHFTSKC